MTQASLKTFGVRLTTPNRVEYDRKSVRVGAMVFALLASFVNRGSLNADAVSVALWGTKDAPAATLKSLVHRTNLVFLRLGCPAEIGTDRGTLVLRTTPTLAA